MESSKTQNCPFFNAATLRQLCAVKVRSITDQTKNRSATDLDHRLRNEAFLKGEFAQKVKNLLLNSLDFFVRDLFWFRRVRYQSGKSDV